MDIHQGRYTVTGRLFNIIDGLSHEKQFILYKQLVKDEILTELFKLIIDLSEDQQYQLMAKLGGTLYADEPMKTINLDDHESFMRENPRKICLIPTTCKIEGRSFKSYIIDISKVGVFIESNEVFPVRQKIVMAFRLPNDHNVFQLTGRIARSGPKGIGVKFQEITPTQENVILKFIESQQ